MQGGKKVSISWWLSETEKKIWHGKKHFMYTYVSISIFVGVIQQDDSDKEKIYIS